MSAAAPDSVVVRVSYRGAAVAGGTYAFDVGYYDLRTGAFLTQSSKDGGPGQAALGDLPTTPWSD